MVRIGDAWVKIFKLLIIIVKELAYNKSMIFLQNQQFKKNIKSLFEWS